MENNTSEEETILVFEPYQHRVSAISVLAILHADALLILILNLMQKRVRLMVDE